MAAAGCVVLTAVAGPAASAAAPAGATGVWSRVTDVTTDNTATLGSARGSDGVLHNVWRRGAGPYSIVDTPISAAGVPAATVTVSANWSGAGNPDAAAGSRGIVALWNGVKSATGHPDGTFEATHPSAGGVWSSSTTPVAPGSTVGDGADISTVVGLDGTAWTAYAGTGVLQVTKLGKTGHNIDSRCCAYYPGLGVDGVTGDVYAGYFAQGSGGTGTFAQRMTAATGVPAGARILLPKSVTGGNAIDPEEKVAIIGRGAGHAGVYAAYKTGYPTSTALRLWHAGSSATTTLASVGAGASILFSAIAADPAGGLWVLWSTNSSGTYSLTARHSNSTATSWSPPVKIKLPAGTSEVYRIYLNAQASKADVLALLDHNFANQLAYYGTQVLNP